MREKGGHSRGFPKRKWLKLGGDGGADEGRGGGWQTTCRQALILGGGDLYLDGVILSSICRRLT